MFIWHSCGVGIYPTRVSPFLSSNTFAWHSWRCHGWWGGRAWGRLGMINFLPWRCWRCWEGNIGEDLITEEPRSERSSPNCTLSEYRFQWDVGFDRWSIRMSIRVHRKAFLATLLLACFRGLTLSRIYSILWHKLWLLHASLAFITVVGLIDVVTVSNSAEFNFFAGHMHLRSGVYNKFSFLWFGGWWRWQKPIFRRWEECCLFSFEWP